MPTDKIKIGNTEYYLPSFKGWTKEMFVESCKGKSNVNVDGAWMIIQVYLSNQKQTNYVKKIDYVPNFAKEIKQVSEII
jgi:hypothetical protein